MSTTLHRCLFCDHAFTGRRRKFCYDCLPGDIVTTSPEYAKRYNDLNRATGGLNCPMLSVLPKSHPARITPQAPPPPPNSCSVCGVDTCRPMYCSRRCHSRASSRRRKTKRKGAKPGDYRPHEIYERDGWRCQLCGGKVRRTRSSSYDPMGATIDHILPLSKGGADARANVQLAHFACNSVKNNRVWGAGEQLRLIG